ncbi:MAG: ATP synthase subunit I [Tissierellia bacterium]|nr:ATP synthase subunit I [Tissierellia bacterium]
MDNAYKFMIRTMKFSIFVFLFELLIIILASDKPMPYMTGLALGYALNLIFFRVMYLNVKSKLEMDTKKAKVFSMINYLARMIITGLFFYVAIMSDKVSFLTSIIAMFNVKIAIYVSVIYDAFVDRKEELS